LSADFHDLKQRHRSSLGEQRDLHPVQADLHRSEANHEHGGTPRSQFVHSDRNRILPQLIRTAKKVH
jgi:hypothetical protein